MTSKVPIEFDQKVSLGFSKDRTILENSPK